MHLWPDRRPEECGEAWGMKNKISVVSSCATPALINVLCP